MSAYNFLGRLLQANGASDFGVDHGLHDAAVGEEADEVAGEGLAGLRGEGSGYRLGSVASHPCVRQKAQGWGTESWFRREGRPGRLTRLRHLHLAGALGVEDESGELAGQVEGEAFGDEDESAAGGDDDLPWC